MKQYDVTVIGAGATGASIAWQLSHYDLKVALVDRCADASFGVSKANSGIVHGGFHHSADSTLKLVPNMFIWNIDDNGSFRREKLSVNFSDQK